MDEHWKIQLFGGLRLRRGNKIISRFRTQKTGALLAYLALHAGRNHPREVLIDLLWPECDSTAGRNSLSVALSSLRRQLEPTGVPAGSVLVADRNSVGLNVKAITTDVGEFETALKRAAETTDNAERIQLLTEAVGHYRGALLPGYYEDWITAEQRRLEEEFFRALHDLITLLEQAGDTQRATSQLEHATALDPRREETHRELIRLYIATGQQEAALRQGHELERLLKKTDEEPSAATRQMIRSIEESVKTEVQGQNSALQISNSADRNHRTEPPAAIPPTQANAPVAPILTSNIPAQFTKFFGREREIEQLHGLLDGQTRLITLTGAGGSGKTRLALEVAQRLIEADATPWHGAIWFVPLADLTDARLISDALLDALRQPPAPGIEAFEQVIKVLSAQPALLLMDNFEQLAEWGPPVVQKLLERVPNLAIIVTSRQRLHLPGERELLVPPLPTPKATLSADELEECASTALFVDRALAARPDFQVGAHNAEALTTLCKRLEGIPLAIELAAARAAVLSVPQILARLEERLDFFTNRQRGVPPRHRTLRAAVDWSYKLLPPELSCFFARLAVFHGGWTPEAASTVCDEPEALDYLVQLRECSLLLAQERGNEMRFRMLETLREYAGEQLSPEEQGIVQQRYCEYYLELATSAEAALNGPEQSQWLNRLEAEQDNLRAALVWTLEHDTTMALQLAASLSSFWEARCHFAEGLRSLETVLEKSHVLELGSGARNTALTTAHAKVLCGAGKLAWYQCNFPTSRAYYEAGLDLYRHLGDTMHIISTLGSLAIVVAHHEDSAAAHLIMDEGVALSQDVKDRQDLLPALVEFSYVLTYEAHTVAARAINTEIAALARAAEDQRSLAVALNFMGHIANYEGDYAAARQYYAESIALFRELGETWSVGHALWGAGNTARYQRCYDEARMLYMESLATQQELKNNLGLPFLLEDLGHLALAEGHLERAACLLGAAQKTRDITGNRRRPLVLRDYERSLVTLRAKLGEVSFNHAWEQGYAMTIEEAVTYAMKESDRMAEDLQQLADQLT